ncbi:MAG: cytochrome c biogenesis protein CcdA [Candidatus Micrarchaeota archaeon]
MSVYELGLAFAGGVGSALLPCVLPVYPFLIKNAVESRKASEMLAKSLVFIFSLSLFYALIGAVFALVLGSVFERNSLRWVSGAIYMLCALWVLGLVKFDALSQLAPKIGGAYTGSFLSGAALGIGFTPCMASFVVALLVASSGSGIGAFLILFAYALGLGATAVFIGLAGNTIARDARVAGLMSALRVVAAAFLFVYGALLLLEYFSYESFLFVKGSAFGMLDWV